MIKRLEHPRLHWMASGDGMFIRACKPRKPVPDQVRSKWKMIRSKVTVEYIAAGAFQPPPLVRRTEEDFSSLGEELEGPSVEDVLRNDDDIKVAVTGEWTEQVAGVLTEASFTGTDKMNVLGTLPEDFRSLQTKVRI